jgi:hypothetical protein
MSPSRRCAACGHSWAAHESAPGVPGPCRAGQCLCQGYMTRGEMIAEAKRERGPNELPREYFEAIVGNARMIEL